MCRTSVNLTAVEPGPDWPLISIMKIKIDETDIAAPPSILDLDQSKEDEEAPQEVCCHTDIVAVT